MKGSLEKLAKRSFSFPFETFSEMESALELIFSPSAASVILFIAALKCGTSSCRKIKRKAKTKEEALNHLSKLKSEQNWGKLSFHDVDFEKGSGKIIVLDSFETVARKTSQPSCHFLRGFLAGFLSELFKKSIKVNEEKCAGKGDEHCEFTFG
jgi:predicted hydrocarbon binding protein